MSNRHFVALEFQPEQDGNVKDIPWPSILEGSVKVVNWQTLNPPLSHHDAMKTVMYHYIHDHEFDSDDEALEAILASKMSAMPAEITMLEKFENMSVFELAEEIESVAENFVGVYRQATATGINNSATLEKLHACAKALQTLFQEVRTCDGYNPNLEGPEHEAEIAAYKALKDAGLIDYDINYYDKGDE